MKNLIFLFTLSSIVALSSCSVNKRLAPLTSALEQAANSDKAPEQKLEVLANTLNTAMTESLVFVNPKKTVQFINRFSQQNEKSIDKILGSLNGHVGSMNLTQKISFFAKTARQPYVKDLKSNTKKVEKKVGRKIKTFTLFAKVLNFLNPLKK